MLIFTVLFLCLLSHQRHHTAEAKSGYVVVLDKEGELEDLEPYFDDKYGFNLMNRDLDESDLSNLEDNEDQLPHIFTSNGDLRLVSNDPYDIVTTDGRLEVFSEALYTLGSGFETEGSWGTVCGDRFSLKEAHVACRQMGFDGAIKWDYAANTEFGAGNSSTPITLAGVKCSKSSGQHLLRCKHNNYYRATSKYTDGCDHSMDVAVFCSSNKRWDKPYRGQVRLIANNSMTFSYGRIEVYQSGQWGTVCKRNFNQHAADSVCRQLGYTGSVEISDAMPGSGLVWVDEVACTSSRPCFTHCFTHHKWTHECNHTQDVAIQCTFDATQASIMTSGDGSKCKIRFFPISLIIACVCLGLSTLMLCGCICILCLVITRCCKTRCYRSRKVHRYDILY